MENIINYVTPEMYGAIGDGKHDDSAAIQAAIDSNKPVVLSNTYKISSTISILKNHQVLTIDGKLIIDLSDDYDAGIVLTGSWNLINGNGIIEVTGTSRKTAIRFLIQGGNNRGNEISVRKIRGVLRHNHHIGIEFVGTEEVGGCCFDKIISNIEFFECGIWCHESENQNASSWYTNLYVDSSINGCVQAIVFEPSARFCGSGSFIKGAIQPFYKRDFETSTSLLTKEEVAELPLVKVNNYCNIETFIWDLGSAANTYAIDVNGYYNTINTPVKEKYLNIPYEFQDRTYVMQNFVKNGCKILSHRDAGVNALNAFSNENDILLDCFNRDDVSIKRSTDAKNYVVAPKPSTWEKILFDGTNANTTPNITKYGWEFEFAEAKSLRGFALWGTKLPDTILLKVLFTGATDFTDIAELKVGIDYPEEGYPYQATWVYTNDDYSTFGGFNKRNIEKLRVEFINDTAKIINVARMSTFDVEPVNITRKANKAYVDDLFHTLKNNAKEACLEWGGKDLANAVSPADAAMASELSANRLAYLPGEYIDIEYSRDGGKTWADYGKTADDKTAFVTVSNSINIGGTEALAAGVTTNDQVRVTITAAKNTLYFRARKALFDLSTNGASDCKVDVEYSTIGDENTFILLKKDIKVSGWSGWNSIDLGNLIFGGNTNTQYRKLRFTFRIGKLGSTNYSNALTITKMRMYGEMAWQTRSNLASIGTIYNYDIKQNVNFPADVKAISFTGLASKASADQAGNNIVDTYATKEELKSAIIALSERVAELERREKNGD